MAGLPLIEAAGSARTVLERLQVVAASGEAAVLALVADTAGSTYRKRGAVALVEADGRKTGVLSGGCLEPQLVAAAQAALDSGRPAWLLFDSLADDDLLFGSGSGCRGRTRVLLWPLAPARDGVLLARLLGLLQGGEPLQLAVDFQADAPRPLLLQAGEQPDAASALVALPALPRAWLVGAGVEAGLLATLLRAAGWRVVLSEHRAGWRDAVDLSAVDLLLPERPAAAALQALPAEVVLVMSHSAETDLQALRLCAESEAARSARVGLLGPPARRDALLTELGPAAAALAGRLHAPVGLRLGGEGPLSIALAIAAWLQGQPPAAAR